MSEYLLINTLVLVIPLLFSFENKIRFIRYVVPFLISFFIVGGIYITWDIFAASAGEWGFNPDYLLGINLFGLPLEEILFFVTVPYASIFVYETAKYYLANREIKINYKMISVSGLLLILISFLFLHKAYTMKALFSAGLFFSAAPIFFRRMISGRIYWYFIIFNFIPFFLVNYFLTSLPVITYSDQAISGLRITTIPVEDFFYSFSLISFFLGVFEQVKTKWKKGKKQQS